MLLTVNTADARAVERQVVVDYQHVFPEAAPDVLLRSFAWVERYFSGEDSGYLAIDARYHDLEHTLKGTLTLSALLRGRAEAGAGPRLERDDFERAILAMLIHDTGYLKQRDDVGGTGAKYTFTHVQRSCDFAGAVLGNQGYTPEQIRGIQNMIRCTGLESAVASIRFQSEVERIAGYSLGTADLLGQMAASDYPEKLPILYDEFREAADFSGAVNESMAFSSARNLMEKTPVFWRRYVLPKLEKEFAGLHHFLDRHDNGTTTNPYVEAVEANLRRLDLSLAGGT